MKASLRSRLARLGAGALPWSPRSRAAIVVSLLIVYAFMAAFFAGRQRPLTVDSGGYLECAAQLADRLAGRPSDPALFAWRTPLYPLMLVTLGGLGLVPVLLVQSLAYFAAGVCAANVAVQEDFVPPRLRLVAFTACLAALTLLPHYVLKYNLKILTNGPSATLLLLTTSQLMTGRRRLALFLATCAALMRAELFAIALLLAACEFRASVRARLIACFLVLVPLLLLCTNNYVHSGFFGPTAFVGFNLANHTGSWADRFASDRYADVLAAWRLAIGEAGTHINTAGRLAGALGRDAVRFSAVTMRDLALAMILSRPDLYAISAAGSIARYGFPVLSDLNLSSVFVSLVFLAYLLAAGYLVRYRERHAFALVAYPVVHMLISSLANHADNLRYRMAFEPVHILAILLVLALCFSRVWRRLAPRCQAALTGGLPG